MKIRNGFVSNSSSSSFVVVLPKKPEYKNDIYDMLFNKKLETITEEYIGSLNTAQISELVYRDLKLTNFKRATLKEIADLFSTRYHYSVRAECIMFDGKKADKDGGTWYPASNKYWGTDKKLLEQIRQSTIKIDKNYKEIQKRATEVEKSGPVRVEYAYEGGSNFKGEFYTDAQIKAYKKYMKEVDFFHKTDKVYKEFIKWRDKILRRDWELEYKYRHALATADAKAFLKGNKGKFIFTTSYGDDGSIGSLMEHGNIFRNVEHERISMH